MKLLTDRNVLLGYYFKIFNSLIQFLKIQSTTANESFQTKQNH